MKKKTTEENILKGLVVFYSKTIFLQGIVGGETTYNLSIHNVLYILYMADFFLNKTKLWLNT